MPAGDPPGTEAEATARAVGQVVQRLRNLYRSWGPDTGIARMRRDWAALHAPPDATAGADADSDVGLVTVDAGGVPAAWISAGDAGPAMEPGAGPAADTGAILFLHGGGYQLGSIRSHLGLSRRLVAASGVPVLALDYRLAPEHRFPAPVEDALAAYDWLTGQGVAAARIAVAGDSAGGGLALALMLALKGRGEPLPAAAVLMSPWVDLELSGESYDTLAGEDPVNTREMLSVVARTYLGRTGDPRNPLASPLRGDLAGLPPMLIQAGSREVVLDDARRLAETAAAAGVEAVLEIAEGMIHVFQLYADDLPAAHAALQSAGGFIARRLA